MALYIKDQKVDDLAAKVQKLTGAKSKTEAVRECLEEKVRFIEANAKRLPTLDELRARVAAMGPSDPDFDMKKFSDELYED